MAAMLVEDDLWAYRAELAARLQETQAELQRVNAVLRAFTGSRGRTFDLLRACIASYGEVDAQAALVYLMSHGWESEFRGNPLNAVRSALAHLAASGEIERVSRGVYRSTGVIRAEKDLRDAAGDE
jgi:hypothetical protein